MKKIYSQNKKIAKLFLDDTRGAIAVIFAVALFAIFLIVGLAVDYTNVFRHRVNVANATDAAIMAAALEVKDQGLVNGDKADIKKNKSAIEKLLASEFKKFFEANMGASSSVAFTETKIAYKMESYESTAKVDFTYDPYVIPDFVKDKVEVTVTASALVRPEQRDAVSMVLVLDRSGSMIGTRERALKIAVNRMSKQFEKSDPKHKYLRLGAIAYNHRAGRLQPLKWGAAAANKFVQTLEPFGTTDSSVAMTRARKALQSGREDRLHKLKNGKEPKKFLVFMTDGNNNIAGADRITRKQCRIAKRRNIKIYTIAFQAPIGGQRLLKKCASTASHYFNAKNSKELLKAFEKIGSVVSEKTAFTE